MSIPLPMLGTAIPPTGRCELLRPGSPLARRRAGGLLCHANPDSSALRKPLIPGGRGRRQHHAAAGSTRRRELRYLRLRHTLSADLLIVAVSVSVRGYEPELFLIDGQ